MSTILTSGNPSPNTRAVSNTKSDRARLYTPLCSWQTRLIKLLPGRRNDLLRCELHIAAITVENGLGIATEPTSVEYDALSYSWGRPDLTGSIECNGLLTRIPLPMQDGLRQLRLEEVSRWMWCDALCINQSVDEEKSAQVRQMMLIFLKARKVIAWLGDAEPETEDMIRAIGHQNALRGKERDESLLSIAGTEISKSTERLLKRPWFSRTWVRQEVFAAQNLELQIGCHTLPFEHFIHVTARFMVSSPQLQTLISSYREKCEEAEKEDLLGGLRASDIFNGSKTYTPRAFSVLHDNKCFEVSDERDRVYALIGIIDGLADYNLARRPHTRRLQHRLPIDYRRNCSFAYQNVMKYLINTDGDLRCLEVLGDRYPVKNLPSWAIDWASHALHCTEKAFTIPRYLVQASKHSSFRMRPAIQDFDEVNQLRLKGFRLGRIGILSPDDMRFLHSAPTPIRVL